MSPTYYGGPTHFKAGKKPQKTSKISQNHSKKLGWGRVIKINVGVGVCVYVGGGRGVIKNKIGWVEVIKNEIGERDNEMRRGVGEGMFLGLFLLKFM